MQRSMKQRQNRCVGNGQPFLWKKDTNGLNREYSNSPKNKNVAGTPQNTARPSTQLWALVLSMSASLWGLICSLVQPNHGFWEIRERESFQISVRLEVSNNDLPMWLLMWLPEPCCHSRIPPNKKTEATTQQRKTTKKPFREHARAWHHSKRKE